MSHPSPSSKQPETEEYGDHSSTYWPPGWNFHRFSKSSSAELLALPKDEFSKLQAGFRNALGEAGMAKMPDNLFRLVKSREEETAMLLPNWLQPGSRPRRHYWDQPWGFVAMQTTCYDNADRWNKFKEEFQRIVEIPFKRDSDFPDALRAKAKFEIRWIEDPVLDQASVEVLRDRYKQLQSDVPRDLSHEVFLSTSTQSIDSVLNVADTDEAPSTESKPWRPLAPYILAVLPFAQPELEEEHAERDWYRSVVKVAAEVLVDEFWPLLDADFMSLRKITRHIKDVDVDDQALATQASDGLEDMWWSITPSPERRRKRRRIE